MISALELHENDSRLVVPEAKSYKKKVKWIYIVRVERSFCLPKVAFEPPIVCTQARGGICSLLNRNCGSFKNKSEKIIWLKSRAAPP